MSSELTELMLRMYYCKLTHPPPCKKVNMFHIPTVSITKGVEMDPVRKQTFGLHN